MAISYPNLKPRRRGFHLVELVLALAILATLAAIAVPRYAAASVTYRLDAIAKRVAADLAYAQATARNTGSTQTIAFDVPANRYTLSGVADIDRSTAPYVVPLANDPYRATLVSAAFASSPTLTFDGFGFPTATGSIVVRVGTIQRTVSVNSAGKATIQ